MQKRELVRAVPTPQNKPAPNLMAGRDNKSELCSTLQMLLGRSLTSEDVQWSSSVRQQLFVASVEAPACGLDATEGSGCITKKAAEQSAAAMALMALCESGARTASTGEVARSEPPRPLSPLASQENAEISSICRRYYFEVSVTHDGQLIAHVCGQGFEDKQLTKQTAAWQACRALSRPRVKFIDADATTRKARQKTSKVASESFKQPAIPETSFNFLSH